MYHRAGYDLGVFRYADISEAVPAEAEHIFALAAVGNKGGGLTVIRIVLDAARLVEPLRDAEGQLAYALAPLLQNRSTGYVFAYVIYELVIGFGDQLRLYVADDPVGRCRRLRN